LPAVHDNPPDVKLFAGGVEVNALLQQLPLFMPPRLKLQHLRQNASDFCTKRAQPAWQRYWCSAAPAELHHTSSSHRMVRKGK
jgi:hypothetical protein